MQCVVCAGELGYQDAQHWSNTYGPEVKNPMCHQCWSAELMKRHFGDAVASIEEAASGLTLVAQDIALMLAFMVKAMAAERILSEPVLSVAAGDAADRVIRYYHTTPAK